MRAIRYLLIVLLFSSVAAQPPGMGMGPGGEDGPMRKRVREKIRTVKIWRMTEALGLTPEQSEKFFPIYNRHEDQMEAIEQDQHELTRRLEAITSDPNSSDKEIEEAINGMKDIMQRRIDLRETFFKDLTGVISVRQKGKLIIFEETFRRDLQNIIREIRRDMGGGPGMNRR